MMSVPRGRSETALRDRLHSRPLSILIMVIVWCALWGSISPMTLAGGVVFGFLVTVVFPLPPMHWEGRFRPIGAVAMVAHLLWDLVRSSWRMLQLAFERKVDLNAGIVRVDLASDSDLYEVIVAELISLVPGTVVVEVVRHPRRLYLHALDLVGPDPIAGVQRMVHDVEGRVLSAFGSRAEIDAFRAALDTLSDEELELEADES